jgi:hypothetical protein
MYKLIILLIISNLTFAQKKQTLYLADLYKKGDLQVVNREIKSVTENGKNFIQLADNKEEGLVWLPVKDFKNGKITIRMRGKDVLQRSFIGITFHALNDTTYDAVYCRPFNFFAKDSFRKIHAIQYISHPQFTWKKLRDERNGVFEKEIINPPNPNDWFTMTIVVDKKSVKAFINQDAKPSLTVEKLTERSNGKLGIFMGDGSGGDFESITIETKQ